LNLQNHATLAIALLLSSVTGCTKSEHDAVSNESNQNVFPVNIVVGATPSESDKSAMLAAKDALFNRLSGRLTEAMGSVGPSGAILVCSEEAKNIAEQVGAEHDVRIGRAGVRLRNPNNQPPAWASKLVEQKSDSPTFAVLSTEQSAALLPIQLQAQCVMCHGPKDQLSPDIQDQLAKLYPQDQATGFREGELRGWFWVETLQ
jgi:hypothetical protein